MLLDQLKLCTLVNKATSIFYLYILLINVNVMLQMSFSKILN